LTIIELVLSLAAILGAAILFTNAVEIFGDRLNLGAGPVGSILAAVGTALPETMIPIVAILGAVIVGSGAAAAGEIGIGAIIGAPFLLSTLALFLVGTSAFVFRSRRRTGTEVVAERDTAVLDVGFFLPCFALAAGAGFFELSLIVKVIIAVALLAAYVYYVVRTVQAGGEAEGEPPERLTLWPGSSRAPMWAVVGTLILTVAVMAVGAHYFVHALEQVSEVVGIPAGIVALILAPLATELPEKFNSILWMRDNKDTLALGNITGAMVFQSTIPVSIGVLFTPWQLGGLTILSAAFALLSGMIFLFFLLRKGPLQAFPLLGAGSLYIVFVIAVIYTTLL
jgi:cation:H+ antiporter